MPIKWLVMTSGCRLRALQCCLRFPGERRNLIRLGPVSKRNLQGREDKNEEINRLPHCAQALLMDVILRHGTLGSHFPCSENNTGNQRVNP